MIAKVRFCAYSGLSNEFLNYLCENKIHILPNGWNKEPMPLPCEGKKNIVHYALYKKPWQYDDVMDGEFFWDYAKQSPYYIEICRRRQEFGEEQRKEKEGTAKEILVHAINIVNSDHTFSNMLSKN